MKTSEDVIEIIDDQHHTGQSSSIQNKGYYHNKPKISKS